MKTTKCFFERATIRWNCWECGYSHTIYLDCQGVFDHFGKRLAKHETILQGSMVVRCRTGFPKDSAAGEGCGAKRRIHFNFDLTKQFTGPKVMKLAKLLRRTNKRLLEAHQAERTKANGIRREKNPKQTRKGKRLRSRLL